MIELIAIIVFGVATLVYRARCQELHLKLELAKYFLGSYKSQLFDQIKQSSIDRKLILHLEACLHERKLTIRELQKQLEERG